MLQREKDIEDMFLRKTRIITQMGIRVKSFEY